MNRQEIFLPDGKIVQAFDGTTAWVINPCWVATRRRRTGRRRGHDEEQRRLRRRPDQLQEQQGQRSSSSARRKLGDKDVYHLKVTMKGGQVQHYFLDAESASS